MKSRIVLFAMLTVVALVMGGCSGIRQTDKVFVAWGATQNLFGLPLVGDDMEAALSHVPEGATITNINASPRSWETFPGFLNNLLGVTFTQIGGTK